MNAKRVFFIMVGGIVLLSCLGIGGVVLGNSVLQKQGLKLLDLKLQNKVLDEEQTALLQANKDIKKYAELEKIAKSIVPQDKDQARAVREIVHLANTSGISLKTIAFPSSTLGQVQTVAPNGANATTPAPAANPPLTQVKAVEGIPGVYSMEVVIQSDDTKTVPYRNFLDFLSRLEQNRRTAQVTNIAILPSTQTKDALTFTITLSLYIKPS